MEPLADEAGDDGPVIGEVVPDNRGDFVGLVRRGDDIDPGVARELLRLYK